jgi:hypothetical protein
MKTTKVINSVLPAAVTIGVLLTAGCSTLTPSTEPMTFIKTHPQYSKFHKTLYDPLSMNQQDYVNVVFRAPAKSIIKFSSGKQIIVSSSNPEVIHMRDGIYPFALLKADSLTKILSGAFMVRNMDKEIALATLGKTDDTKMLNNDLVRTALKGQLASYTVSFDGKDVITYWMGNRKKSYIGGDPTVELDFSHIPGISMLKVGNKLCDDKRAVVKVYAPEKTYDSASQRMVSRQLEHPIEFTADGSKYRGYVRKLRDNEFTAFVCIPCAIPESLLKAAAAGTVSKFTVMSTGDAPESVAEIIISSM